MSEEINLSFYLVGWINFQLQTCLNLYDSGGSFETLFGETKGSKICVAMHQTLSIYKGDFICQCDIHGHVVNKATKSSSPIIFSSATDTEELSKCITNKQFFYCGDSM